MGLHRHGPAQYLYIYDLPQVTSLTRLYYQSVEPELIADNE
jgi:hypothetical protein